MPVAPGAESEQHIIAKKAQEIANMLNEGQCSDLINTEVKEIVYVVQCYMNRFNVNRTRRFRIDATLTKILHNASPELMRELESQMLLDHEHDHGSMFNHRIPKAKL